MPSCDIPVPVITAQRINFRSCVLRLSSLLVILIATAASHLLAADSVALPPAATRSVEFVKDIQPILAENCLRCHGEERAEADLRWDSKASAFKGGDHGPVLVPGKSADSRVIHLVAGLDPKNVMPKKGERLTPAQVGLLRAWIDQGANWPEAASVKISNKRDHWAFKPPVRPAVPPLNKSVLGNQSGRRAALPGCLAA